MLHKSGGAAALPPEHNPVPSLGLPLGVADSRFQQLHLPPVPPRREQHRLLAVLVRAARMEPDGTAAGEVPQPLRLQSAAASTALWACRVGDPHMGCCIYSRAMTKPDWEHV